MTPLASSGRLLPCDAQPVLLLGDRVPRLQPWRGADAPVPEGRGLRADHREDAGDHRGAGLREAVFRTRGRFAPTWRATARLARVGRCFSGRAHKRGQRNGTAPIVGINGSLDRVRNRTECVRGAREVRRARGQERRTPYYLLAGGVEDLSWPLRENRNRLMCLLQAACSCWVISCWTGTHGGTPIA
jgi:hypothetical protein